MSDNFTAQLDALIAQAQTETDGAAEQADVLEKDFEREERAAIQAEAGVTADPDPVSAPAVAVGVETPEQKLRRLELSKAVIGAIGTDKMIHGDMIFNGICTACVRCRLKLTDAVSIERGMGPECSSKGYAEDPTDPDEMGAMIELAEFPALVDFLTLHYKPLGVRGLMNGLVRIAALNRKSPVHPACANAIEMLGYKNLAGALRDALIIMKIKKSEKHAGHLHVRVRGKEWNRDWQTDCYRNIPHSFYDKQEKGLIVADRPQTKAALWTNMMKHYAGECASTPNGTVRIPTPEEWAAQRAAKREAAKAK